MWCSSSGWIPTSALVQSAGAGCICDECEACGEGDHEFLIRRLRVSLVLALSGHLSHAYMTLSPPYIYEMLSNLTDTE